MTSLNLNELLKFYEPEPDPCEYWFDHVYQLYRLGLPMTNPYPETWFAHKYISKAITLILTLVQKHGEVTSEAFADAKRRAISEIKWTYTLRW